MHSARRVGNPSGVGGGVRGKVKTFTLASRRRFRLVLVRNEAREGWVSYGVTYTIPPPVLSVNTSRELWASWCALARNRGWAVIWRAELQKRQALHWHCLVAARTDDAGRTASELQSSWFRVLDASFPYVKYSHAVGVGPGEEGLAVAGPLSWSPGAQRHCVRVEYAESGRGAWYRYLSDHASKVKREQIGENIGRHWGVVGRKHLRRITGRFLAMDAKQYARFRRAYERMATPRVKDDRAPFGRRAGFRCKRGRWGSAVSFVKTGTCERLAKWATS